MRYNSSGNLFFGSDRMKEPVTGVQLYTLRDHIKTAADFDKTLSRLAAMGVRDVQISGIGKDVSAAAQKESLDRYGMRVCVTHQSYDRITHDLPALIDLHRAIGCDALGLGCAPKTARGTLKNIRAFIRDMENAAKQLQEYGITFHYHNHDFEFEKLRRCDRTMMDVLLAESDPTLFHLIPDVAWMHYAGVDPVSFLRENAARIKVVHFKDYAGKKTGKPRFVSLGQGIVPLEECFAVCRALELPYVVYEQDDGWTDGDPFLATEESLRCFERLHRMP